MNYFFKVLGAICLFGWVGILCTFFIIGFILQEIGVPIEVAKKFAIVLAGITTVVVAGIITYKDWKKENPYKTIDFRYYFVVGFLSLCLGCWGGYEMSPGAATANRIELQNYYDTGYSAGYDEGYNSAYELCSEDVNYENGYSAGYEEGKNKFYNLGYDEGFEDAEEKYYDIGYDKGYDVGYAAASLKTSTSYSQSYNSSGSSYNVSQTVYVTNTGTKYHKSGCQYLHSSKIAINLNEAKKQGYDPCSKCY